MCFILFLIEVSAKSFSLAYTFFCKALTFFFFKNVLSFGILKRVQWAYFLSIKMSPFINIYVTVEVRLVMQVKASGPQYSS